MRSQCGHPVSSVGALSIPSREQEQQPQARMDSKNQGKGHNDHLSHTTQRTHTHIYQHTHMHNTAFWSHKPTRTNTTMLHEDVTRLRHTSFNVRSIDNLIFYSAYTFPLLLSSVYP